MTLPIPQQVFNLFSGYFIHHDFSKKTKKLSFYYSKPSVEEWRLKISSLLELDEKAFQIYLVSLYEGIYLVGRESTAEIIYKAENENKNIFVFELSQEEQSYENRV